MNSKRKVRFGLLGLIALASVLGSQSAFCQTLGQGYDDGISVWRIVIVLLLGVGLRPLAHTHSKPAWAAVVLQFSIRVGAE
ncbi:MAG: hypothetical protein WDM89_06905 [Rhizomicrobium sp.]